MIRRDVETIAKAADKCAAISLRRERSAARDADTLAELTFAGDAEEMMTLATELRSGVTDDSDVQRTHRSLARHLRRKMRHALRQMISCLRDGDIILTRTYGDEAVSCATRIAALGKQRVDAMSRP